MRQYSPGSQARFVATFQFSDGARFDPTNPKIVFQDPVGGVAEVPLVKQGATGMYGANFTIPAATTPGFYDYYFHGTYLDLVGDVVEHSGPMECLEVVQIGATMDALPQGWYCTVGDIRVRLPLLTQAKMSDENVQMFIIGSMGEVDAKLANRYPVPFTNVPSVIRAVTRDLASADILDTMFSGDANGDPSPLAERLRKNALELLEPIITGKTLLPGSSGSAPFRLSNFKVVTGEPTPIRDMFKNLEGWGPPGVAP